MRLHEKQLPCPKDEFLSKLSAYTAEREAHKLTVGVPAPFPEYEILRVLYEHGGDVEVYSDPEPEPLPVDPPREPTALEKITSLERTEGQGVYVRGVREFMLGMAQVIAAQGGPDILQTPGMQNVKRLDDKIKALRSQIK